MLTRTELVLAAAAAALTVSPAQVQRLGCDSRQTACFDLPVDLQVRDEIPRNGYSRPDDTGIDSGLREVDVYRLLGMDFTPFTCTRIGGEDRLAGQDGTDVEHMVAMAEAWDRGLPVKLLDLFYIDPANLTLATPRENRNIKNDKDAADYLPEHNACWFAAQVVRVKARWGLAVDAREGQFLMTALAGCSSEQIARPTCEDVAPAGTEEEEADQPVQDYPPVRPSRRRGFRADRARVTSRSRRRITIEP